MRGTTQGLILTYAAYLTEAYLVGRVHFVLIGAIGLGALMGAVKLISISASLGRKLTTYVFGKRLDPSATPRLYDFVRGLAKELGAKPPDHIVLGLDLNFFVTSADVGLVGPNETLNGETLFVSAPLARLLSHEEFTAVLGHELGHFRGGDTEYSLKFAPVYAGLSSAVGALASEEGSGSAGLAKIPAIAILSYMIEVFAINESAIGREREFVADQAGVEAASREAMASALVKVSLYSGLWAQVESSNIERLKKGEFARNLSSIFQNAAKDDVDHESIDKIKTEILKKSIPHPTDTHPPTSDRLEALNLLPSEITKAMLLVPERPAIELLEDYTAIEEELTTVWNSFMSALERMEASAEPTEDVAESAHASELH